MKYLIPLLSLFIIYSPGEILGFKFETVPEPVNTVISKSFTSVCQLKGDKVAHELSTLTNYSIKVAGRINTKLTDNKSKQEDLITSMCRKDIKLRSSLETFIKEICHSQAPQSKIVQEIIDETCSSLVPKTLKSWHDGNGIQIPNGTAR